MASAPKRTLETLEFINTAVRSLPLDSIKDNYVRTVPGESSELVTVATVISGLHNVSKFSWDVSKLGFLVLLLKAST